MVFNLFFYLKNCGIESLRVWSIVMRNNNTNRPGSCIDIEENLNKNVKNSQGLFCERTFFFLFFLDF